MMVRPAHFGFNPQTAEDNAFQVNDQSMSIDEIATAARREFDHMVSGLRDRGVEVLVIDDTADPVKYDAVFPNNWISTHATGHIVLYPMYAPVRRLERRSDIIDQLNSLSPEAQIVDYSDSEESDVYVEGTGAMILDRQHDIIYACVSERSHQSLLERIAEEWQYDLVTFDAVDVEGTPYYHTNVIMAVGTDMVVLCTECIEDASQRKKVVEKIKSTGKELIEISRDQVLQFAGNMLEVRGENDQAILVMSEAAFQSLTPSQISKISEFVEIFSVPLPIIERYGGGSARCMMAEIFL